MIAENIRLTLVGWAESRAIKTVDELVMAIEQVETTDWLEIFLTNRANARLPQWPDQPAQWFDEWSVGLRVFDSSEVHLYVAADIWTSALEGEIRRLGLPVIERVSADKLKWTE